MAKSNKKNDKELSYAELVARRDELKQVYGFAFQNGNRPCR